MPVLFPGTRNTEINKTEKSHTQGNYFPVLPIQIPKPTPIQKTES